MLGYNDVMIGNETLDIKHFELNLLSDVLNLI